MRKEAAEDRAARFGKSVRQIEVGDLVDGNDKISKERKDKVKAFIMHSAHDEHDGDAHAEDGQGAARTKAPRPATASNKS